MWDFLAMFSLMVLLAVTPVKGVGVNETEMEWLIADFKKNLWTFVPSTM